jgi:protein-S-isoprenylcysteine O-methyltransferase Ste14
MSELDRGPGLPIAPPLIPLSALIIAIVLDWLPLRFMAEPLSFNLQVIAGVVLLAVGFWLDISAVRLFFREGTNPMPTQPALKVVTTGPYRFTRNPMYLGMVAILLGLSLVFSLEWGVIFTPIVWIVMDRVIVLREEAYLNRKFGADYHALLMRTRRWL